MIRLQVRNPTDEQLAEEQMVPVCCDGFEAAFAAGIMTQARGIVYVKQGPALWRVRFCLWCGTAVEDQETELLLHVPELTTAQPGPAETRHRRLRCEICDRPGHRAKKCPKREKTY